jgi:chloramphenicol-sensitive protein RarD
MPPARESGGEARLALSAGIGCYMIWGFMPLAFQAIGRHGVGAWELLSNRILWGIPAAVVFVLLAGQGREAAVVARRPRVFAWLCVSSLLIAANWAVFIWAVNSGRLLEGAVGYYINPLVSLAGGALVFHERIDRFGKAAIGLALAGVAIQALALGHLPWVSIVLALSFGFYGIVRKRVESY